MNLKDLDSRPMDDNINSRLKGTTWIKETKTKVRQAEHFLCSEVLTRSKGLTSRENKQRLQQNPNLIPKAPPPKQQNKFDIKMAIIPQRNKLQQRIQPWQINTSSLQQESPKHQKKKWENPKHRPRDCKKKRLFSGPRTRRLPPARSIWQAQILPPKTR